MQVSYEDVVSAHARIRAFVHETPVVRNQSVDDAVGASVWFKCENLQRVGAFKYRGATNAVRSLSEAEASRGVATHSSGNHAQALALAARTRGVPAHIVMPSSAPAVKRAAVEGYGGRITTCEPTLDARERTLAEVIEETGAHFVHPYNDVRVIAGQGTAAKELLEAHPDLDVVLTPVGGGGLMSGTAISVAALAPHAKMIAVEPAAADDAYRSFKAGTLIPSHNPVTVADGLLTSLGPITFEIMQARVHDVVTVGEEAIMHAMRFFWMRTKLIIEPSAAVVLAALLEGKVRGRRIGAILSGGNVDLDKLPWMLS